MTTTPIPLTFYVLTELFNIHKDALSLEHQVPFSSWYSQFVARVIADPAFTGSLIPVGNITRIVGDIPESYYLELEEKGINVAAGVSPYIHYNLASIKFEEEIAKEQSLDMNKHPNFWGNRKPIYQQISKAKYDRIVNGRGHRAIVETNPYFRMKQGINRLYGTAISCYVLFNRAYWYNEKRDKYFSMQLNGYTVDEFKDLSISTAYYASNRNSRDWTMIEVEWLLKRQIMPCRLLKSYKLHRSDHTAFTAIFEELLYSEFLPVDLLLKIRHIFDDTGKVNETNLNLFT